MSNPLLDFSDLPRFDRITPDDVGPAVDMLLEKANAALETVTAPDFPARWDAIAKVLDVATEHLGTAWGAISHLNSVADTPELRAAYNAVLPRVTEFWTRLGADERLYAKYKAIDPATLTPEQRQAHKNAVRNFVLSGAELTGAAKERFAQIQERQAELSQKFSENALDATDAFAYYATAQELDGVPADVQQTALAAAQAEGKSGYKLTLKMPCYLPVMQFATRSALRETMYRAYVTRASDQAEGEARRFDNSALIREILMLRREEARLLGYDNFGQVSVVPKMAQSPGEVVSFLRDLARRARPYAEKDVADLRDFAASQLGLHDPQAWDWPYLAEKLNCLEAVAAGPAIAERALMGAQAGKSPILMKYYEANGGFLKAENVGDAAKEGDALATEVIRESGQLVGDVLATSSFFLVSTLITGSPSAWNPSTWVLRSPNCASDPDDGCLPGFSSSPAGCNQPV